MLIYRVTRHTWFGESSEGKGYLTYLSPNRKVLLTLELPADALKLWSVTAGSHQLRGSYTPRDTMWGIFLILSVHHQKRVFGSRDAT